MLNYTNEQINQVMQNLDSITYKGVNNAGLIMGIYQILNSPTKEVGQKPESEVKE